MVVKGLEKKKSFICLVRLFACLYERKQANIKWTELLTKLTLSGSNVQAKLPCNLHCWL